MLDSTDPAAFAPPRPPARTLYILASKSGDNRPNSLAAHFRHRLERAWPTERPFRRDYRRGDDLARRAQGERFEMCSSIRPTSAGGIRRCHFSGSSLRP
jgi:hypothetical protein